MSTVDEQPRRTVQLRRYELAPGDVDAFTRWWSTWLRPARLMAGFTIEFAYSVPERDEFVWAVSVPGDHASFSRTEAVYLASPERAAAMAQLLSPALSQHVSFAVAV